MIKILPLEPLDKRYTKQWYGWYQDVFKKEGVEYQYVTGEKIKSNLDVGFLDMKATFVYKFDQLRKLFKGEPPEWIFLMDGEFPGIEAIEYYRKFYGAKTKIAAIWHAGTYDQNDLTAQKGLTRVGTKLEEAWMDITDEIFVATKYHKKLITENRNVNADKIHVTGLPIDWHKLKSYESKERDGYITFTGRLSPEKGMDIIERVEQWAWIYKTQAHNLSKNQFYKKLAKAKAIFAPSKQETFGYGVVEAMAMNIRPIVPDGLSFTDYVPKQFRYKNSIEMTKMIQSNETCRVSDCVRKYDYNRVIKEMLRYLK